jgi:ABC-type uncharacterized transport system permease subunit
VCLGVKRSGIEANQSSRARHEVKNVRRSTCNSSICLHCMQRVNVAFISTDIVLNSFYYKNFLPAALITLKLFTLNVHKRTTINTTSVRKRVVLNLR